MWCDIFLLLHVFWSINSLLLQLCCSCVDNKRLYKLTVISQILQITTSSCLSTSFLRPMRPCIKSGKRKGKGKGSGVWPSMVTHTRNLSSAFNPSKCTLTAVNTHLEQWAAILRRPGSSWGIGALLKGLTSVVVLKVERALVIHSPHRQSLPDLGIEPATFGLQVQLSNH